VAARCLAKPLERLPGFRRRIRITPGTGSVLCEVEDDFHCMGVRIRHADGVVTGVEPDLRRAPWTTCPGAEAQLQATFAGLALADFANRGEKRANCTHLYDLALLAAAHAGDQLPLVYDILVSDPVDGYRRAEIRRDGATLLGWTELGFEIVDPPALAGRSLMALRTWIDLIDPTLHEPARLLQWANMIANGRIIPLDQQSDATQMPPNCYTFQPERARVAKRVGLIRDFSRDGEQPLELR
jgi:hypothetical protein